MIPSVLSLLENHPVLQVSGLRGSSAAWLAGMVSQQHNVCCIVADEYQVALFEQDADLFTSQPLLTYPGYEIPPYTPLSPDGRTTAARLASLYRRLTDNQTSILITSIEAMMRRLLPSSVLTGQAELIERGEETDSEQLRKTLVQLGYEQVALVQTVGDFSVRGGIFDIFPPSFTAGGNQCVEGPIRLDFFGDTVESIRLFDPISQRSSGDVSEAIILPVHDVITRKDPASCKQLAQGFKKYGQTAHWQEDEAYQLYEKVASGRKFAGMEFYLPLFYLSAHQPSSTFFDYLPENTLFILIEPEAIRQSAQLVHERITSNFQERAANCHPCLPPEMLFLSPEELFGQISRHKNIICTDFPSEANQHLHLVTSGHQLLKQEIQLNRTKRGLLPAMLEQISSWRQAQDQIILCCRSPRHTRTLAEMLSKQGLDFSQLEPPLAVDSETRASQPHLKLCNHPLAAGFSLPELKTHILSESELFGEMRLGSKKKSDKRRHDPTRFAELRDGDIVVHRDHGLGMYLGMQTITVQGVVNDFMLLEYRDGDKLYLPVDRLNLITKYEGLADQQPKIDKLGTQTWKTTKAKVKEEVWKKAQELLAIYAQRELQEGRQFSPPAELFADLEESFPYDETPGQDKAISDVISDLTAERPMDRLVCGDVGYGKTEVAIRAAFKVVEDGAQVAVLVPTTVLAEQHGKTFRERLQGFPVTVECINRFKTTSQQKKIVTDLKAGRIDIIIGTHRLLSKDVAFRDLGLLIIDEEHRFGVAHKERLKKMRAEVDILTLTATPIPRTLQMSLLNIRDLSVISSPPEHRQPVKTFVANYDELVVKEAISKELRRGGQVFFVHNRVQSIQKIASSLQKLVPESRIAIAHGQMAGKQLEDIMVSFVQHEIDVLVCTTIIESGLDIPAANTIIINRADRLGLAEIYQLRGRVGRSTTQSFAYLLVPSIDSLSKDSRDRLRALMDCSELGGGFKLSMSDLQIRGGGNLLGVSQSGHIAAIGYELYLELLQSTVADLKAKAMSNSECITSDDLDPEINLQISAYIPEGYIQDISQRYIIYRRIAALFSADDSSSTDLIDELVDRFGPLPEETRNLLKIVEIKRGMASLRISKLDRGKDSLVFTFQNDTPLTPEMMLEYIQKYTRRKKGILFKLTPDNRLVVNSMTSSVAAVFDLASSVLSSLEAMLHGK